jgi:hypothetical protein
MTITGAVSSATQLTASVSFTLNLVPQQLTLVLERASAPASAGKLALAADPGVNTAVQNQHIAAVMSIMPDGRLSANLLESEMTGLPLCPVLGGRFALLTGVVTSSGSVIAIGGMPGTSETALTRSFTAPPSVVFLTGTINADGTVSATIAGSDITGGGLKIPPLNFVAATNPLVGVFVGTHTVDKPIFPTGKVAFGVNNDGSVHGYDRNFFPPLKRFPEKDDLLDGVVDAGGVLGIPPAFAIKNLAPLGIPPAPAGLVMTDDDGNNFGAFVGVYSGSIDPVAGTSSGTITTGPVIATESFSATLLQ